jgi:hypothetical protein
VGSLGSWSRQPGLECKSTLSFCYFEIGFPYVALAGLELVILASHSAGGNSELQHTSGRCKCLPALLDQSGMAPGLGCSPW